MNARPSSTETKCARGGGSHLYRGSYFTYFILIFKFVQYCKVRIWKAPMLTSTRSSKLLEHFCLLSTQTKTLTQALVLGRHTHTQPISKELGWDWFSPVQIPLPSMLWGGRGFPVFKSCYPVCFEVASGAVCLRETPGEEDSLWRRLVTCWEAINHVVQLSRMYVWEVLLPVPGGKVSPFGVLESLQVSASSHLTLRPLQRKKNGGGTLLWAWSLDRPVPSRRQEGLELWRWWESASLGMGVQSVGGVEVR